MYVYGAVATCAGSAGIREASKCIMAIISALLRPSDFVGDAVFGGAVFGGAVFVDAMDLGGNG